MNQKPYDDLLSHEGIRISICMAAYNGARFIREQIASILPQLGEHDEFVIVDDASQDDTINIIESFRDERIRIVRQDQNRGVVQSFGAALRHARGEVIFLADQDDIWRADKVERFLEMFSAQPDLTLVMSDLVIINAAGTVTSGPKFASQGFHRGLFRTLVQNGYQGSAMAFRRFVLGFCLPFPIDIPIHDVWIGLVNRFVGKTGFIPEPLLFYRRHGTNESPSTHAPLMRMLGWRWALVKNLASRYLQTAAFRRPRTPGSC
jgi:glycosyltransferase involved in cell wall biosynthesis